MKLETHNVKRLDVELEQNDEKQQCWAFACATGNSDRLWLHTFAQHRVNGRTVCKQIHCVES